jgi:hypothetical protein
MYLSGRKSTHGPPRGRDKTGGRSIGDLQRLGDAAGQAQCLTDVARLLHSNKQLGAAEEAAFRAIDLLSDKDEQFLVCESHRILGGIYHSRGETERPFTISRSPARSHPPSAGTNNCFSSTMTWRGCFVKKGGSMTHKLTLNVPSSHAAQSHIPPGSCDAAAGRLVVQTGQARRGEV